MRKVKEKWMIGSWKRKKISLMKKVGRERTEDASHEGRILLASKEHKLSIDNFEIDQEKIVFCFTREVPAHSK